MKRSAKTARPAFLLEIIYCMQRVTSDTHDTHRQWRGQKNLGAPTCLILGGYRLSKHKMAIYVKHLRGLWATPGPHLATHMAVVTSWPAPFVTRLQCDEDHSIKTSKN